MFFIVRHKLAKIFEDFLTIDVQDRKWPAVAAVEVSLLASDCLQLSNRIVNGQQRDLR